MSTLIIAAVIIIAIIAICTLLISIDKKQKRKAMHHFLNNLSRAGSANNLTFSSQELLQDCAIGLDGLHRKLAVLTRFSDGKYFDVIMDLDDVKRCSVKKIYDFINAGLKHQKLEQHLKEIVLHIEFDDGGEADIPFYNYIHNPMFRVADLEQKAGKWESIISKLLKDRIKKIA